MARRVHEIKQREDVFVLPPASDVRAMTLGYHAAASDLLWADLLVEHGIHVSEHREFFDIERYIDAIIALEPDFPLLYRFVDTLLVYRERRGTEEEKKAALEHDARRARTYFERGITERPGDADIWLNYGQFLAFLAPSCLRSQEEGDRWRRDGAEAMARAVELGATLDRALSAATLLSKSGERDAAIRFLRRSYALTDDPETREQIARKLQRLEASAEGDAAQHALSVIEEQWRTSYPFLPADLYLLVGPFTEPARCAGPASADEAACARDWDAVLARRR